VDAVVSIAGQAAFRPLPALTDADFALGLNNKLMGQVNLVRFGIETDSSRQPSIDRREAVVRMPR